MSALAEPAHAALRPQLRSLLRAARTALAADAVAVLDVRGAAPVVVAGDGLSADEAAAVAGAISAVASGADTCTAVEIGDFAAGSYWQAGIAGGVAAGLCALRREPGSFERTILAPAFARHAGCALALGDRPSGAEDRTPGDAASPALAAAGWEDLLRWVAAEARRVLGARRAGVMLWDEEAGALQLLPGSFGFDAQAVACARATGGDWWSSAARVFSTGQPYLVNDVASDRALLHEYLDAFGITRMASVPLGAGGHRVGVLELTDRETEFGLADLRAAAALAARVAVAVELARERFGLRRRHRLEQILGRAAVDIAAGKSLQEFLGPTLDDLCQATDATLLAVVPHVGEPVVWRRGGVRRDLEEIVLADGHHANGPRAHVTGSRAPADPGWAALHLPILVDGDHVGRLSALRLRGHAFDRDERAAMSRLANLTALAWATERYQRRQAHLARVAERDRIADELHDDVAQLLFAARLSLESAVETDDVPASVVAGVDHAGELITRADTAIRRVMRELAPPAHDDLGQRLAATVAAVEDEFGHAVQLELSPPAVAAACALGSSRASLLARVTREALVNASKHAGPCQLAVRLTLTRRRRLLLAVSDDGVGARTVRDRPGHGLAALRRAVRHHGGDLRVRAAPTGGTRVSVSLPL